MYYYWDWTILLLIPAFALAGYAQFKVSSTYRKYSKLLSQKGVTGAQVAAQILAKAGVDDVKIVPSGRGKLSDHYDPGKQEIRLSAEVYQSTSVSAIGVAAHECGHALQEHAGYLPYRLRSALVPVAQVGSFAAFPLILLGFLLSSLALTNVGIVLYALVVAFYFVVLPVELDASHRALTILGGEGYLTAQELTGSKKVLHAAAFTYLASALIALLQLLRFVLLSRRR